MSTRNVQLAVITFPNEVRGEPRFADGYRPADFYM
jgi:hypothetical protein